MSKRPHDILGVSPRATAKQVRTAYKRLARKVHPDRDPSPDAATRFMAIKQAHDDMLGMIRAGGYPEDAAPRPPPPKPPRAAQAPPPPRRPVPPPPPRRPPPRAQEATPSGSPWVTYEKGPIRPERSAARAAEAWSTATAKAKPRDMWTPTLWAIGVLGWFMFFGLFLATMRSFDLLINPPTDQEEGAETGVPGR